MEDRNKKHIELYTTETCGACKLIKDYLKNIDEVNIKEYMLSDETRKRFVEVGALSAPTIIFYQNGIEYERREGFLPQGKLMELYLKSV